MVTQHFRQLPDGSLQGLRLPAPGSLGPVALPAAAAVGGKVNAVAPPGVSPQQNHSCVLLHEGLWPALLLHARNGILPRFCAVTPYLRRTMASLLRSRGNLQEELCSSGTRCMRAGRGQSEEAGKEAAAQAALMASMGGGMRLTLTQREAAARQAVVLPWEQRRAGAASQDDLGSGAGRPREQAAGVQIDAAHEQQEEAQQGYGRIIYERDSETDPDSDEDPDDDLDF